MAPGDRFHARPQASRRVAYVEEMPGAGAPIVLLHGVLDSRELWRPVAQRLHAAGRRVLLVDSRGHGAAEPWAPGMDWSPRAGADDLLAALKEPAHLVGHSRGAQIAGWIAVEEPALALSLAIVASPPQASEAFRAYFRGLLGRAAAGSARAAECYQYLANIPEDDLPGALLRRYRGRALVVEPSDDPLYAPTSTLFWRAFLPFADFERPPGGHRLPVEQPEWLAERLLRHVRAAEST